MVATIRLLDEKQILYVTVGINGMQNLNYYARLQNHLKIYPWKLLESKKKMVMSFF
jgi:hypothetical protein